MSDTDRPRPDEIANRRGFLRAAAGGFAILALGPETVWGRSLLLRASRPVSLRDCTTTTSWSESGSSTAAFATGGSFTWSLTLEETSSGTETYILETGGTETSTHTWVVFGQAVTVHETEGITQDPDNSFSITRSFSGHSISISKSYGPHTTISHTQSWSRTATGTTTCREGTSGGVGGHIFGGADDAFEVQCVDLGRDLRDPRTREGRPARLDF